MTQDELKKQVAWRALDYLVADSVVGVGTGSTVGYFIEALATVKDKVSGAVSSSEQSSTLLAAYGITVLDANQVDSIQVYVDGADEINPAKQLIKGGGAALTREKIVAAMAKQFVCIADSSKQVDVLGKFPLPIEVIPMARAYIARQLVKLGGRPEYRQGIVTDNGNHILDVYGLSIVDPRQLETQLNGLAGVVTVGLFAHRPADIVLIGENNGVRVLA